MTNLKPGDKIIMPKVTKAQLFEIGITRKVHYLQILKLIGKEVEITEVSEAASWGNLQYSGYFCVKENVFNFPFNWIANI